MDKMRLETFSDGVIAILITIMVLEMKAPLTAQFTSLAPLIPMGLSYVLSFLYLGIYWNNHHHMFHTCKKVTGAIMWANLHLLFWLSLVPIVTAWMGQNHFATAPVAVYGLILLFSAIAYWTLQKTIVHSQGKDSLLKKAIGRDLKGIGSILLYVSAIALSFWSTKGAEIVYLLVALIWILPDRRIEKILQNSSSAKA